MDPKCKEMMEKMQEYLDGECSEETCRMVEKHLSDCHDCGSCMESIKQTIALLKKARQRRSLMTLNDRCGKP